MFRCNGLPPDKVFRTTMDAYGNEPLTRDVPKDGLAGARARGGKGEATGQDRILEPIGGQLPKESLRPICFQTAPSRAVPANFHAKQGIGLYTLALLLQKAGKLDGQAEVVDEAAAVTNAAAGSGCAYELFGDMEPSFFAFSFRPLPFPRTQGLMMPAASESPIVAFVGIVLGLRLSTYNRDSM
eukprot:s1622_g25.t1